MGEPRDMGYHGGSDAGKVDALELPVQAVAPTLYYTDLLASITFAGYNILRSSTSDLGVFRWLQSRV